MKKTVYLDNSATTKPSKRACEYINSALTENWGNPSSLHSLGFKAELTVCECRKALAKKLNANENEIIFMGSGTEANNTALLTARRLKKTGNKIIVSAIEHPSVLETVKRLEAEGFNVVKLQPQSNGVISLEALEKELNSETVLVSIMLVNNEVGSIEPIKDAVRLVRRLSPRALFHCDAVQGFGKLPINVKDLGVDLLTVSGHKIHGPKGIGALYCKKGVTVSPLITGGGQERGLRSGTEAVPLIAGFLGAICDLTDEKAALKNVSELNSYLRSEFSKTGLGNINSSPEALPYILNISVLGYRSETLLHFLENKGIFVSSGSACAKGEASYVLKALGLSRNESDSALRISFSNDNTKEDIDCLIEALKEAALKIRRT